MTIMSDRRKRIFRESLFLVPFLLIVTVVTLLLMYRTGRTIRDTAELIADNLTVNEDMDISVYTDDFDDDKYTLQYYYGETGESTLYAEFVCNTKDEDEPVYCLTLYEERGGYSAGAYETEWFHSEEYISYEPLDGSDGETTSTLVDEAPQTYSYIKSYSYDSLLSDYGVYTEQIKGYKLLGLLSYYTWDTSDRVNCIFGIGGKPLRFYTYPNDNTTEYKKVVLS